MAFKAQSAPQPDCDWWGYCKRFTTRKTVRNAPNPKGWVGKTPFTALCSLKITGYCLRRMPCDWHFSDPAQICNQRQQNLGIGKSLITWFVLFPAKSAPLEFKDA